MGSIKQLNIKNFVLITLVFLIVLSTFWTLHSQQLQPATKFYGISSPYINHSDIFYNENQNEQVVETIKYILLWTKFFDSKNWDLGSDTLEREYFENINCNITSCVITSNRKLLPSITDYDALLFHAARPWTEIHPLQRKDHQTYVMAILESLANTNHDFDHDHDFFNVTMTYRLDSDIVWPYSAIVDTETDEQVAPVPKTSLPNWRKAEQNFFDQTMLDAAKKKTKFAAWFVSNCQTSSQREKLVRSMQQHCSVDIYGACGPFRCPRFTNRCFEALDNDYKFYLAFENSLFEDYVTEKFFDNLKRFVVPVVYGGADYSKFAPPMSYIDANDFETVAELVEYLVYLDQHPEEYIKYFWWKKYYRIEASTPFCDLCKNLHDGDKNVRRQVYTDPRGWWFKDNHKRTARIKF